MVITPVNWNLFSVNVFMAATGLYQLYRIATNDGVEEAAAAEAKADPAAAATKAQQK